ncbi:MAG TPA: hypothetical protein VKA48_09030, partial [Gammaproteobacteria bacterium]|nr:hypothetical protein [Gammaproteobacteria bacterium]
MVEEDAARQGMALLQVPASAARAMEAHQTLADYEAVFDERLAGEDHRAFLRWRQAYRDRLRDGGWIDTPQAWDRIETAL